MIRHTVRTSLAHSNRIKQLSDKLDVSVAEVMRRCLILGIEYLESGIGITQEDKIRQLTTERDTAKRLAKLGIMSAINIRRDIQGVLDLAEDPMLEDHMLPDWIYE